MSNTKAKTSLFAGLLAAYAGLMLANPVFPSLARELGLSEVQAGIVISAAALVFAVGSPLWGWLCDRAGRKPVFVAGLVGIGLSFILFAGVSYLGLIGVLTGTALFAALLAARVVIGAMIGGVPVSAQAYMADITETADRSAGMALIGAVNGLGTLLGPALAAVLVTFGLLVPFFAGAVIALAAAALLVFVMPRSPRQQIMERPPKIMPWDGRIWPFLLFAFATVTIIVLLQITLGFYLIDRFGLTPVNAAQWASISLFAVGIALAVVQGVFVARFKWSPHTLLRSGPPIMVVGLIGAVLAPSVPLLVAAFSVMGVGGGLLFPGFTSGASLAVSEDEQGAMAGLNTATNGAGAVFGPLIATALYQIDVTAPFLGGAVVFAALAVFAWTHPILRPASTAQAG